MTQLDFLDSRLESLVRATPERREQTENLERVRDRIEGAICEFFDLECGMTFHLSQLQAWVLARRPGTVASSVDRVMRDLRDRGAISYELVSRSKSLYRCMGVT